MAAKNKTISANDLAFFIKDWLKSKGYPRVKRGLKESGMPLCYSAYYQLRKSPNTALSVKSIEKVLNYMGYKAEISINIKISVPCKET